MKGRRATSVTPSLSLSQPFILLKAPLARPAAFSPLFSKPSFSESQIGFSRFSSVDISPVPSEYFSAFHNAWERRRQDPWGSYKQPTCGLFPILSLTILSLMYSQSHTTCHWPGWQNGTSMFGGSVPAPPPFALPLPLVCKSAHSTLNWEFLIALTDNAKRT